MQPRYLMLEKTEKILLKEKIKKLFSIGRLLDASLTDNFQTILKKRGVENAEKEIKIKTLNKELTPFCDITADSFPGVGLGYYSKALDVILVYSPSALFKHKVGLSLFDDHMGRQVLQEKKELVGLGSMVRGDVMTCWHPLIRNNEIIGFCWANETIKDIYSQIYENTSESFLNENIEPLLGLSGLSMALTKDLLVLKEKEKPYKKRYKKINSYIKFFLNNVNIGIVVFKNKNKIVYLNKSVENMLRINHLEWLGKSAKQFEKKFFPKDIPLFLDYIGENRFKNVNIKTNPDTVKKINIISRLFYVNRERFHFLFLEDSEKALQQREKEFRNEKLSVLGEVSAFLAHEIKNPMTVIEGAIQLIPEKIEDKKYLLKLFKVLKEEARRIDKLVESLLNFANVSKLSFITIDLNKFVKKVLDIFRDHFKELNIVLEEEYANREIAVNGDEEYLKQALMNLIINAIQAMPDGGILKVVVNNKKSGNFFQIVFSDTGKGVPSEDYEKIFSPFFTTKVNGTGLGLSLVHKIINEHRGFIECKRNGENGMTFIINIPKKNLFMTVQEIHEN